MRFYTVEQISKRLSETPEGFLLCADVPITRTGLLLYGANEVPIDASPDGTIQIERLPDDVFHSDTVASFEGKPVTINHPDSMVTPDNWKELAVGTVQNVRRGTESDDLLLADLLITDKEAIELVRSEEMREVSCGYDAEYEQTAPGRGLQRNIIGNHVALVDKGRCGSRCAIGDKKTLEVNDMATKKERFFDRLFRFFDEAEETEEEKEETKDEATYPAAALTSFGERLTAIEAAISKLAAAEADETTETTDEESEEEKEKKKEDETKDCSSKFSDAKYRAEILAPGIKPPTLDSKKPHDTINGLKRTALTTAFADSAKRGVIEKFTGASPDFAKLPQATIDAAFIGASELIAASNNSGLIRPGVSTKDFGKAPLTIAYINAHNRTFWESRS